MKDIKEKPSGRAPKENSAGRIPKAALKKAWTKAKDNQAFRIQPQGEADEHGAYSDTEARPLQFTRRFTRSGRIPSVTK